MLITQTDIASFTLGVIANLVKAKPLSEEQASDLLRREQNGLGRTHVLKLLADQVDKAVERDCEGNNVSTRVGKGLGGNLLDPEVSAFVLYPFVSTSFLDENGHKCIYIYIYVCVCVCVCTSTRTQHMFSCTYTH